MKLCNVEAQRSSALGHIVVFAILAIWSGRIGFYPAFSCTAVGYLSRLNDSTKKYPIVVCYLAEDVGEDVNVTSLILRI